MAVKITCFILLSFLFFATIQGPKTKQHKNPTIFTSMLMTLGMEIWAVMEQQKLLRRMWTA